MAGDDAVSAVSQDRIIEAEPLDRLRDLRDLCLGVGAGVAALLRGCGGLDERGVQPFLPAASMVGHGSEHPRQRGALWREMVGLVGLNEEVWPPLYICHFFLTFYVGYED